MTDVWKSIGGLQTDAVVVTVAAVRGSVPGEAGAKAVVTADGLVAGNLGGGRVEARAIAEARELLAAGGGPRLATWNLQRDVGMTCGGEMTFLFEPVAARSSWHILIFGAGHVVRALVPVLATLDCRVDVVDTRREWLDGLPVAANTTRHLVTDYEDAAVLAGPDTYVISITKGHATDRPVLREILSQQPRLPFIGVIGSAAKRAVLLRELRDDGLRSESLDGLVCPLGLPVGGNDPAEIAISVAAQLLQRRGEADEEARLDPDCVP